MKSWKTAVAAAVLAFTGSAYASTAVAARENAAPWFNTTAREQQLQQESSAGPARTAPTPDWFNTTPRQEQLQAEASRVGMVLDAPAATHAGQRWFNSTVGE